MDATYKEAAGRAIRKKLTERVAQKRDVITVCEVREKIAKQAEDVIEKVRNALRQV